MEYSSAYQKAKGKAKLLRKLYSHIQTYLIVNSAFFILNYLTDPENLWVLCPIIGWGFFLMIHIVDTYAKVYKYNDNWEKRKIEELMQK